MAFPPKTQYTHTGSHSIAYQVFGEGPIDLLLVPGFVSHLELAWEDPDYTDFLLKLSSFARLILFDKQGTGLSDRITPYVTLEERMDDVRAVLDAVGCEKAHLFGISEGGAMSVLFAATYPQKVESMILYGTIGKGWLCEDYSFGGWTPEQMETTINSWKDHWGDPHLIHIMGPSVKDDPKTRELWARYLRMSAGPTTVENLFRMYAQIDLSPVLPSIQTPTLILHKEEDQLIEIDQAHFLRQQIVGSELKILKGQDHFWWIGDRDHLANEIQKFVTGEKNTTASKKVWTNVLFTDIVRSTEILSELGNESWKDLLQKHNSILSNEILEFKGREIKNTGDGILAIFDGPVRAIQAAQSMVSKIKELGIEIRAGIHSGEIESLGLDIGGLTVHVAARVMGEAEASEILVSQAVKTISNSPEFNFEKKKTVSLKGVVGDWDLFQVQQ